MLFKAFDHYKISRDQSAISNDAPLELFRYIVLTPDSFKEKTNSHIAKKTYCRNAHAAGNRKKKLQIVRLANLPELNNLGTTKDAAEVFGGLNILVNAFYKLQEQLYAR